MADAVGQGYVPELTSDIFAQSLTARTEAIKPCVCADQFWYNYSACVEERAVERAFRQLSCFSGIVALLSGYYLLGQLLFA